MSDTYSSYESSTEQGRPIQFYRFTLPVEGQSPIIWTYTNADEDITVGGQTFMTSPITDDGIKETGEAAGDAMKITAPDNVGPAVAYGSSPPAAGIKVEILRMHEGMTTLRICYVGEISGIGNTKPGQCEITALTMSATMKRTGLRICYQRPCPYSLYDTLTCKVDKASHGVGSYIRSINGTIVFIDAAVSKPENYFAGGFVEWPHPVHGLQRIMIESSTSDGNVVIFDDVQELAVGQPVTIYPGCAKTPDACRSFDNYVNYGGFEYMPGKSPYDGNPIF